ncbi:MAG: (d)CMP kinase [Salinarimonas sp.]
MQEFAHDRKSDPHAPLVIAIDGPAGSGKGTLARRLAAHYGLRHLDTGLLYRAVARLMLDKNRPLEDEQAAHAVASTLNLHFIEEKRLRGREIGEAASIVSAYPPVRQALFDQQRAFATQPPGAVLDGRDIGTVIFPDALVKLFVIASAEERARRRHKELSEAGEAVDYPAILDDIRRRDDRDMNRASAPLKPADDAVTLDTTTLDPQAAFEAACGIIEKALGRA